MVHICDIFYYISYIVVYTAELGDERVSTFEDIWHQAEISYEMAPHTSKSRQRSLTRNHEI